MLRHDFARNLRRFRRNPRQLVNLVLDPDRPVVLLQLLRAKGFARVRSPAHDVADTADLVEVLDQLPPRLQQPLDGRGNFRQRQPLHHLPACRAHERRRRDGDQNAGAALVRNGRFHRLPDVATSREEAFQPDFLQQVINPRGQLADLVQRVAIPHIIRDRHKGPPAPGAIGGPWAGVEPR